MHASQLEKMFPDRRYITLLHVTSYWPEEWGYSERLVASALYTLRQSDAPIYAKTVAALTGLRENTVGDARKNLVTRQIIANKKD